MKRFFNKPIALILLALLVIVSGLGAALHSYTGPQNRTRTETGQACVYMLRYCVFKNDRWLWNAENSWSCGNQSQPWLAYPPLAGRECTSEVHKSGPNAYGYQQETVVAEITVILPPATISAQPLCSLVGQNGWCRAGAGLQLSGYEPVDGYSIFALGGTRNGVGFTLQAATATILVIEGQNNFEYWAYSTWGDTSLKGTSTLLFDSQPPSLDAWLSGTSGSNDWLKSAALHASASDPSPGSGLDSLAYTLNGGSNWASLVSPASLPDGVHSLQVRASDLAGNTSLSEQMDAKVDSLAPTLAISESGTSGSNGWYISPAQVSASADDSGSGLAALEYSLNNGAWSAYSTALILPDGSHSLNFWAEDFAGWVTQEARSIRVDTRAPNISGNISGTLGANDWYVSTVTLSASASDPEPGSGMDTFTYLLNGGPATAYSAPINLADGQHSLTLNARDQAGLESSQDMAVKVDTIPPSLQILTTLPEWVRDTVTLSGTAADAGSGLQRVEISFDNGQTWQAASGAADWSLVWDTRSVASGARTLYVKSTDMAGLSTILPLAAQVDNTPPQIQLPGAWDIWEAVTFDAHDSDSGLANAELVISDPQNRWPKRVYTYQPGHLPLSFTWDRRFADGTLAPMGSYDVSATATDRMGNTRKVSASLRILIVLPPPATSTPLGEPLATASPTATPSALATLAATSTPTNGAGSIPFGATPHLTPPHLTPDTSPLAPRATPTESAFSSWLGSLLTPTSQSPAVESPSPIEWGAGALAAAAGMSAYYLAKRREEEEAQRQAMREQVAAKNDALRAQEAQQREQAKIENYLQGKAMLEAQLAQSGLSDAEKDAIRAQAQAEGMSAGLNLTAATVAAQQARHEVDNAWLAQADKSESQRLEDYQKSPEHQAREIERLAILNWIKTGENPPSSMLDKTEDERLAMYKDAYAYQSQQASLAAWQAEQEHKKFSGYSDWEKQILQKLYKDGGPDAKHGVDFILKNRILIKIGEQFSITTDKVETPYMNMPVPVIKGDWQSMGDISGWYTKQHIVLHPNNNNYTQIPDNWALSVVIHEARHIEQGPFIAFTKDGELDAYQVGIRVFMNLEGKSFSQLDPYIQDMYSSTSGKEYGQKVKKYLPDYWKGLRLLPPYGD
jgi:hypothetical protein